MFLTAVILEALRSMNANRLRTMLTMLGIVIGIASVSVMLAIGDGMRSFVSKELEIMGTNMLFVAPGGNRAAAQRGRADAAPQLTMADAEAIATLPGVAGAGPELQGGVRVSSGNETSTSQVRGVLPAMFELRNWKIDQGSSFSDADVRSAARAVVIGRKVADQFFYRLDPLGRTLRIENMPFEVVGVLAGEGSQVDGPDISESIIVPLTAARAYLVRQQFPNNIHKIVVQGKSGMDLDDTVDDITELLRDRHRIRYEEPDDFRINNLASIAETAARITGGLSMALGLIGAISLVVGGIGIMNIMLVSVTERTREIGIRMAIGAKPRDILAQFLVEAVLICVTGGIVGVSIAALCAWAIRANTEFAIAVTPSAVLIACGFASLVGIFFGYYPARRAARLQPVECLRYE